MITPWNWPLNQIACKVAPALAAGCTMILKPSEFTPSSALIFAEILHEAGVPKGVFNLINGLGPEVGAAMSEHPDIDMISFTGSTRAGIDVAKRAAPTVKRVSQELGGKVAERHPRRRRPHQGRHGGVMHMFNNPASRATRRRGLIVPLSKMKGSRRHRQGRGRQDQGWRSPRPRHHHRPRVSRIQWDKIQKLIQRASRKVPLWCRRSGLPEGVQQGLLCASDHLRRRHHDMTSRGRKLRGRCSPSSAPRMRNRRGEDRPMIRRIGLAVTSQPTLWRAPAGSAARSAPATSTCRACRTIAPRRSAATSSPATARMGQYGRKNISRSRRSPASTPR